ncbi:unnamed protein product [Cyprideis torosa]|uniref:MD-2-related lipid-recognition domain-containing protein n=1 Tax=Cyprideis torosa TaxID=163714 RepID=A0A7R8WAV7_9CRUS|nr:unnamed protein product [Cyprideis torosa]CAG0886256.1 unnamed protein product [Cyprideis torosa]
MIRFVSRHLLVLLIASVATAKLKNASVEDCAGANAPIRFLDGSISPDQIPIPGALNLEVALDVLEDLPEDLQLSLNLKKLDPDLTVPCLDGIGSCTYDVCPLFDVAGDLLCAIFPNPDECQCPIPSGSYGTQPGSPLVLEVPYIDDIITAILVGRFEGTMTFHRPSTPDEALGCLLLKFELIDGNP